MAIMAMSYMSLEFFSFERTKILNGKKVWEYNKAITNHITKYECPQSVFDFSYSTLVYRGENVRKTLKNSTAMVFAPKIWFLIESAKKSQCFAWLLGGNGICDMCCQSH